MSDLEQTLPHSSWGTVTSRHVYPTVVVIETHVCVTCVSNVCHVCVVMVTLLPPQQDEMEGLKERNRALELNTKVC